jgi:hypothetical protein
VDVTKNRYGKHWARWNEKLSVHATLIDLADIRTISRRMYETGKISRKVHKKWLARGRKNIYGNSNLRTFKPCDHRWMPYSSDRLGSSMLHWRCDRCRCSTTRIYYDEAPISFRQAPYVQHMRFREEDE